MPYYQRNILILSTTIFLAALSWQQIIPFLPRFLEQLGAGEHVVAWSYAVFMLQAVGNIFAQPLWGKLADTVGRKPMIIRAGVCLAGIYFAMSFCTQLWHVALCRFLNGVLTGFIPSSFALIASNTPEKKAPRYIATAQSAAAAGLILGPAIGGVLAKAVGYRGSMQVSGIAVLVSTLLVWMLVKEPNKVSETEKTSILQDLAESAKSRVLGPVMFAVMVAAVFANAITPILALHLQSMQKNLSDLYSGLIFALPAFAFVLTAHMWTRFGEKWGYERMLIIGLAGGGLASLVLALTHSVWMFCGVYFASGLMMASISPAVGALICLKIESSFRARAYAIQGSTSMLGALLALLAALYVGAAFGTTAVFVLVGICLLIGAVVLRLFINRKRKPQ